MSAQPPKHRHQTERVIFTFIGLIVVMMLFMLRPTSTQRSGLTVLRSSIDTAQFDGRYRLVPEESFQTYRNQLADAEANLAKQIAEGKPHDRQLALSIQDLKDLIQSASEQHSGFIIHDGVIHSGTLLVQEFSLRRAEIVGDTLTGSARWHEDVLDPGDVHDIEVRLILKGDRLEFSLGAKGEGFGEAVVLERVASGD